MSKSFFASLLLALIFTFPSVAQDSKVGRWMDLLVLEQVRSEKSERLSGAPAINSLRAQIELEHKFNLVQELIRGGDVMDKTATRAKLFKVAQKIKPYKKIKNKRISTTAKAAYSEVFKLMMFVKNLSPITHQILLQNHVEKRGGVIRKSVKHGVMELPGETVRFVTAIILVRIHNCFGTNGGSLLQWKTSYKDPACVHEIWEMLKSPVFYAGFTAFVVTSRASQAALSSWMQLDKALKAGASVSLKAAAISNFSLAAGFFADHVVQTIANNKDLHQCASKLSLERSVKSINPTEENIKKHYMGYIGKSNKGQEIYSYTKRFWNPHCKKFLEHLGSKEFLWEHTFLVPLPSLLLSAGALTIVTSAVTKVMGKKVPEQGLSKAERFRKVNNLRKKKLLHALKIGKKIKNLSVGIIFVPGVGTVAGFALGVGRLVVFFKLNELIEPIIKQGYYNSFVKVWNNSRHQALRDGQDDFVKNWHDIKNQGTTSLTDKSNKSSLLLDKEKCSDHYMGKPTDSIKLCSRVPLVTDMSTFRDYSSVWRQKKILGKFFEGYSRWKTKMDDSIYHYSSTLYQMRIMSMSREMKYSSNGRVDYYDRFFIQIDKSIHQAAKDALSDMPKGAPHGYNPLEEVTKIYEKFAALGQEQAKQRNIILRSLDEKDRELVKHFNVEDDYTKKRKAILDSLGPKEERLFNLIQHKDFLEQEFKALTDGNVYQNVAYSDEEISTLKNMALRLLTDDVEFNISYLNTLSMNSGVSRLLKKLELDKTFINGSARRRESQVSLKHIIRGMIQNENDDISGQGLYLLKNTLHRLISIDHSRGYYPVIRDIKPEQKNLLNRLHHRLRDMDPTYRYEYLYGRLLGTKASEESTDTIRWVKNKGLMSTKHISNYTMSQFFCDQASTTADWFGNEGTPHVFQHPQLGGATNYCKNYLFPLGASENSKHSLNASFFVTEQGVQQGLLQVYLNLPEGNNIFNTERETRAWWVKKFEPKAMNDLIRFEGQYKTLVKNELTPKIGNTYRAGKILEIHRDNMVMQMIKNRGFFGFSTESLEYSAGEDLAESLSAELKEYQQVLHKVGAPFATSPSWIYQRNLAFSRCFVNLLGSLQGKNYKPLKKQCEKNLDELKNNILFGDNFTQRELFHLSRMDEGQLTKENIAKLILATAFTMIDKIMSEVDSYKKMNTGELNLNLKKMKKKDCFEHNLNNFRLTETLTEKENENNEDYGSCFKSATNN